MFNVLLKNGQTVQVSPDDIETFLRENREQIQPQHKKMQPRRRSVSAEHQSPHPKPELNSNAVNTQPAMFDIGSYIMIIASIFIGQCIFPYLLKVQAQPSSLEVPEADKPYLPNSKLTPGSIFPNVTTDKICVTGYPQTVRNVSQSERLQVFRAYGIPYNTSKQYELDHLISLELGGSNEVTNLWLQPYENGQYGAKAKDKLENELHKLVCNGSIPLTQAQKEISSDWVAAYRKYIKIS